MPGLRAPGTKRGQRRAAPPARFRPAQRSCHARSATRTETSSPASTAIRSAWERSAPARRIARRNCARVCRSPRLRPAAATSTRRSISWSGDWPGTVCWSTASGARETARTRSSSSRRLPIIGRERRSSAMPTFSSCRGSPTCDGAATRWCWNRRAPARCSGFAIRRLRPPSPCCRHRSQSNGSAGRTVFPGVELLALLVDCQILFKVDAAGDSGLRPAEGDDDLVLWDFHDLLFHTRSTEGRHANPLGGVYPYAGVMPPLPAVRPRWPGKKIDLRKLSAAHSQAISPVAKLLRERHSTRSFDDQTTDHARRACAVSRRHRARPVAMEQPARPRRRRSDGRVCRQAVSVGGRAATSSSSIWRSTNAKGLPADSIITTPADTRWCRSASARMSSKRC